MTRITKPTSDARRSGQRDPQNVASCRLACVEHREAGKAPRDFERVERYVQPTEVERPEPTGAADPHVDLGPEPCSSHCCVTELVQEGRGNEDQHETNQSPERPWPRLYEVLDRRRDAREAHQTRIG